MSVTAMKPIGVYVQLTQQETELALDALTVMYLKSPSTRAARQILIDKLCIAAYGTPSRDEPAIVISTVCDAFHLHPQQLLGPRRDQHTALRRQITFYLFRMMTKLSFPDIGRYFNRDHSTVVYAVRIITARMARDSAFRGMIHRLQAAIGDKHNNHSEGPDEESGEAS